MEFRTAIPGTVECPCKERLPMGEMDTAHVHTAGYGMDYLCEQGRLTLVQEVATD